MRQSNVSKKLTAMIRVWVSVGLILIATCLSLTPVLTLHTAESEDRIREGIERILADTLPTEATEADETSVREKLKGVDIPETVNVSAIKLVKSVLLIGQVTRVTSNMVKPENLTAARERLAEKLASEDGKETVVIALAVSSTISANFKGNVTGDGAFFANLLTVAVSEIAVFALLILTMIQPIRLLFLLILSAVQALLHLLNPEKVAERIARRLPSVAVLPLVLMLCQCVVPGMSFTAGTVLICCVAVASAVLGVVISRLEGHDPVMLRYLNVMQCTSAVGLVGFFVFFFNLIKTNVMLHFLQGKMGGYIASAVVAAVGKRVVNKLFLIDFSLMILYLAFVYLSMTYLIRCARRLSCIPTRVGKKRRLPREALLAWAIAMLPVYLIPAYVAGQKHYFADPSTVGKVGEASFLILGDNEKKALIMTLVGIVLIVLAEIALMVLRRVLCRDTKVPTKVTPAEETESIPEEPTEEMSEASAKDFVEESMEESSEESVEESMEESVEAAEAEVLSRAEETVSESEVTENGEEKTDAFSEVE